MYNGGTILPLGGYTTTIVNPKNQQAHEADFVVIGRAPILLPGALTCQETDLVHFMTENIEGPVPVYCLSVAPITEDQIRSHFADVFADELGCLEGEVHLE